MATLSEFLIERLENAGIKHVFGVPGDYCLKFYEQLYNSPIDVINTTDEAHAGFAADAYARLNGAGCVCVTYNVGTLKLANAVACAYAEKSPLVVISGSPGVVERNDDMLLHHTVRSYDCQKDVFKNITCASTVLDNPDTAGYEIDRVLGEMKHHKLPVYIELPRDLVEKPSTYDVYGIGTPKMQETDPENLEEALEEVVGWIDSAKNPVILAGVEVARFGLGKQLLKFAEKGNIPIATTLLSKSVISETHPLFAGVYSGSASREGVSDLVEESDCLIMFGVLLTDLTLSFNPKRFAKRQTVAVSVSELKVKNHTYTNVLMTDFCESLFKAEVKERPIGDLPKKAVVEDFVPKPDTPLTTKRLFEKINAILDKNMAILADIGDSLFGASDLVVHDSNQFISPAFYTSMGASIPGALGVQSLNPKTRPIVIVGDGAFQMACTELGTIVKRGLNPIVIVLNNGGYNTERLILDGDFNDIPDWEYEKIVEMIGGGKGFRVETEESLDSAMDIALDSDELTVLNVLVGREVSPALERITSGLSKRI